MQWRGCLMGWTQSFARTRGRSLAHRTHGAGGPRRKSSRGPCCPEREEPTTWRRHRVRGKVGHDEIRREAHDEESDEHDREEAERRGAMHVVVRGVWRLFRDGVLLMSVKIVRARPDSGGFKIRTTVRLRVARNGHQ